MVPHTVFTGYASGAHSSDIYGIRDWWTWELSDRDRVFSFLILHGRHSGERRDNEIAI